MSEPFPGFKALVPYFDKDSAEWSYPNFLYEMRKVIFGIEPFSEDWSGLDGTWYKRFAKLANNDEIYPHPSMKIFFEDLIFERTKRTAQRNYIKTTIDVLDKTRTYGAQEITSDISEVLVTKRSFSYETTVESSKKTKIDENDFDSPSCDEESLFTDPGATSVESETTDLDSSPVSAQTAKIPKPRNYINNDIANEVLEKYQTHVLPEEKLTYDGVNILDFAYSRMKDMKKTEVAKSPLCIRVINIHNLDCTRYLPHNYNNYVVNQLRDYSIEAVYFDSEKKIDKFIVDCEDDVLSYLDHFYEVDNLKSLARCLNDNQINLSTASNDLIYVQNLFYHFFFLYKNDFLVQTMSEGEYNSYVWTPLLRNAFLEKNDLKLNYGELASRSYEKLKEMLDIGGRSAPKLDGKGFLKSLGTEILAQEDGILNTRGKRKGDLQKLEFCSKVILTTLFLVLPSGAKSKIKNIETYSLQSSGFRLTISASKYLFEDTIVTMDLQDVEVPKTVEGFSNLVVAVKVVLSWKARTRKNTTAFYEALRIGHRRLTKGAYFSPKKVPINSA